MTMRSCPTRWGPDCKVGIQIFRTSSIMTFCRWTLRRNAHRSAEYHGKDSFSYFHTSTIMKQHEQTGTHLSWTRHSKAASDCGQPCVVNIEYAEMLRKDIWKLFWCILDKTILRKQRVHTEQQHKSNRQLKNIPTLFSEKEELQLNFSVHL